MNPRALEMVSSSPRNGSESDEDVNAIKLCDLKTVDDDEPIAEDSILQPGTKIKPNVTENDAVKLAERLYGIVATEIGEMVSYDDRNYLIIADKNIKNPIIPNTWSHGYVLKIVNSLDSKKTAFIDAQTQLLLFLGQQNIKCPKPVMNIYGKYYSTEKIGTSKNVVRLLEYQPGKIFTEVIKTNFLYYEVGEFVAKMGMALKHFKHDAYDAHKSLWMLEAVPKVAEFLYVIKDEERKDIVEQVLDEFEKKVMQNFDQFEKGIIHGDFNEQNILVEKIENRNEYKVNGVIDFGDTSYSPYVFDLAVTMAYMMLQSGDLHTGGLIMAGYEMFRILTETEKNVLKVCIAGRLCQSLVLGAYSHTLDPENDYLLITQTAGWELLFKLWAQSDDTLKDIWKTTADNYLKQSTK